MGDNSTNYMTELSRHLLQDYDGLVRPVKDGKKATVVTYRMAVYSLLDMVCRPCNRRYYSLTSLSYQVCFLAKQR